MSCYEALSRFIERFQDYFSDGETHCPFGPNYGGASYQYICFLGGGPGGSGGEYGPWEDPEYGFFLPLKYVAQTLGWATINRCVQDLSVTVHLDQDHA